MAMRGLHELDDGEFVLTLFRIAACGAFAMLSQYTV